MLDLIVQQVQQHHLTFTIIKEVLSFVSCLAITTITLYTAWLSFFSKDIKIIGTSWFSDRHIGETLSLFIENKTLSNFVLQKVDMVVDNKYILTIKNFDEPFILEPFKAYKIVCKGITDICEFDLSKLSDSSTKSYYILYSTSTKIKAAFKRPRFYGGIFDNTKTLTMSAINQNIFNNKVLNKDVKYALSILCESGNYKDILIDKHGFMSENLFDFNAIPQDTAKDFETCYNFFKALGERRGLTFYFYNVQYGKSRSYHHFKHNENKIRND